MHLTAHHETVYVPEFLGDRILKLSNGKREVIPMKYSLNAPASVSVTSSSVAVADFYNNRIILKDKNHWSTIGSMGHEKGELFCPTDVVLRHRKIYVADAYNHRIQVFALSGEALKVIGENDSLRVASGLDITDEFIAIIDQENDRVLVYNLQGKRLQTLNKGIHYPTDVLFNDGHLFLVVNFEGKSITDFKINSMQDSRFKLIPH